MFLSDFYLIFNLFLVTVSYGFLVRPLFFFLHTTFLSIVYGVSAQVQSELQIKQSPTWVTIPQLTLIVPTNIPFQISVSNIGKGCSFLKVPPGYHFFHLLSENDLYFQVNILNAISLNNRFSTQGWGPISEHFLYIHFIFSIPLRKSLIFLIRLKITKKRYIMGQLYLPSTKRGVIS